MRRMKQRSINLDQIIHIINNPVLHQKTIDGNMVVIGSINNKSIKVIYSHKKNYIKIIIIIIIIRLK